MDYESIYQIAPKLFEAFPDMEAFSQALLKLYFHSWERSTTLATKSNGLLIYFQFPENVIMRDLAYRRKALLLIFMLYVWRRD